MPSVVDICNNALDKLGHGSIISLTDGSTAAKLCNRNWPLARNKVLRDHPWNFAVKRVATAPSTTPPVWGFSYEHPLPNDCLRLLEVCGMSTDDYQLEGRSILTNSSVLYIRYIAEITDPNMYDVVFQDVVATRLALEVCESLTQSNTKKEILWNEYQESLITARKIDAQENPPIALVEDDWIKIRY